MVQSKSVSELSQISGLSDLPIPTKVENFLTAARRKSQERKKSSKSEEVKDQTKPADYYQFSPMAIHDNIYQTLPKSMKIEVMVKSKVQLPSEITQTRKECVSSGTWCNILLSSTQYMFNKEECMGGSPRAPVFVVLLLADNGFLPGTFELATTE